MASWENHLPEETTYEQLHLFVRPKVFFVSYPSLNLGGREQKVTLHEETGFRVQDLRGRRFWGHKMGT